MHPACAAAAMEHRERHRQFIQIKKRKLHYFPSCAGSLFNGVVPRTPKGAVLKGSCSGPFGCSFFLGGHAQDPRSYRKGLSKARLMNKKILP